LPCKSHAVPILKGIAYFIIEYIISVEINQEVFPSGGGIGIGFFREGRAGELAQGIGVGFGRGDIAAGVVGIEDGYICLLVVNPD
jgi:hypothetical protein